LQGVLNLTGLGCGFATFPREYCPFSQPLLTNSIVWQNRSFYYTQTPTPADPPVPGTQLVGQLLPDPGTPVFNDLAVLGVAGSLDPRNSVLTDTTGYHASNTSGDPLFVNSYFNGDRALSIVQPEFTTSLTVRPALDEGGNFLDVTFGPLALTGDYHLQTGSAAFQRGDLVQLLQSFLLLTDYDNALRPICLLPDAGADELVTACALATATAPAAVTTANTPLTLSVTALGVSLHSAGGGGAPLAAIAVRTPTANGATVAMSEDRSQLTYTPATNWTGADTLVAVVSDGVNLRTTTATVTVNPNTADASAGDAPTQPAATADAAGSVTAEGVASVAADSVPAGSSGRSGPLSYALAGMPLEEAAYLAKAQLPEEMAEPANEAPSVSNDEFAVWEYDVGKGYYVFADFSVLDNDHDADGDHMKAELVEDVKVGRVKLAADGTFTYVPAAKGKTPKGALSFKYRVSDGKTTSELATVTFTVQKVTKGAAKPGAKQDGAKLKPSSGKPDTTVSPPAVKANGATEKSQINSAQASATTRR
jgi:hypothetical protein